MRKVFGSLFGNERGATIVLVCLMLIVLMGFAALVVDVGQAYSVKRQLQTAADAAALAAVREDSDGAAFASAGTYIGLNLPGAALTSTAANVTKTDAVVDASATVNTTFGRVLGMNELTVSAHARAIRSADIFDYTLFATGEEDDDEDDRDLEVSGNIEIHGSCHSNNDVNKGHYGFQTDDGLTYCGDVDNKVKIEDNNGQSAEPTELSDPIYPSSSFLQWWAEKEAGATEVTGDPDSYSFVWGIDKVYYIDGPFEYGGGLSESGIIIAEGDITLSGSCNSNSIILYSKNGNIRFNGSSKQSIGVCYAPNGSITCNGSIKDLDGRYIAGRVDLNGGGAVNGKVVDDDILPKFVKLIE